MFIVGLVWLMILSPLATSFLGLAGVMLVTSLIVDTRGELDNLTEEGKRQCKEKATSKDRKERKESKIKIEETKVEKELVNALIPVFAFGVFLAALAILCGRVFGSVSQ